jgi:uncharacterized protein
MKALKELQIISPLLINKITKQDIRDLSKEMNLPTWDKPAYACLLTRIPYNTEIKHKDLRMIEKAEVFLHELGYKASRVRIHGKSARIEVPQSDIAMIADENNREKIIHSFTEIGFEQIMLDLRGYRMGSMNNQIREQKA